MRAVAAETRADVRTAHTVSDARVKALDLQADAAEGKAERPQLASALELRAAVAERCADLSH